MNKAERLIDGITSLQEWSRKSKKLESRKPEQNSGATANMTCTNGSVIKRSLRWPNKSGRWRRQNWEPPPYCERNGASKGRAYRGVLICVNTSKHFASLIRSITGVVLHLEPTVTVEPVQPVRNAATHILVE
jgi:hypothetical protein